jgi:hypothetical protein
VDEVHEGLAFSDSASAVDERIVSADELCDVCGRQGAEIALVHRDSSLSLGRQA